MGHTETGPVDHTETGHVDRTETGHVDHTEIGHEDRTETGLEDCTVTSHMGCKEGDQDHPVLNVHMMQNMAAYLVLTVEYCVTLQCECWNLPS